MEFGSAIPLHDRPGFFEGTGLAPFRDSRNVGQSWKKSRTMQRQQTATVEQLQKVVRIVSGMKRRIVGGSPIETPVVNGFPFCIYQVQNITATPAQSQQFASLGENINDFTYQIRGGVVGVRPYISGLNNVNGSFSPLTSTMTGNSELLISVVNTDFSNSFQPQTGLSNDFYYPQSPNTGGCVILDDINPTLIYGVPSGSPAGTAAVTYNQICLNPNTDGGAQFQSCLAGFWLELLDDFTNGFCVNLWGQMYASDTLSRRTANPFPTASNIIPLGTVSIDWPFYSVPGYPVPPAGPTAQTILQIQPNNLVNRYPNGYSTTRGRWTEIYAALPAGATRVVWYPGDVVVDDSTIISFAGINAYRVWQYIGTAQFVVIGAVPSAPNWQIVGLTDS